MDIAAELLYRNARFRAFRQCGVPLSAEWSRDTALGSGKGVVTLRLACSACRYTRDDITPEAALRPLSRSLLRRGRFGAAESDLARVERDAVARAAAGAGCPHLSPLLGVDPPDVAALIPFELLAGP